jgi:hypothetical protein
MGRGLLADAGCAAAGHLHGRGRLPEVTQLVEDSDGLFLLGVILSDTNFAVSEKKIDLRRSIVACDGEVRLGWHVYPTFRWRRWWRRCWRAPHRASWPSKCRAAPTRGGWWPTMRRSRRQTSPPRSTT